MKDLDQYDRIVLEKVSRISDILIRIGQVDYLKNRLSLYGGTAINLLRVNDIPRLSVDIDFNYRDIGENDWGEERDKIDDLLKRILKDLDYPGESVKVQPSYPLSRLEVIYETYNGNRSSVKIETGYLRRMPILKSDESCIFHHPISHMKTDILSPKREELFANKFCTMLSRSRPILNGRDIFDVWTISKESFDMEVFMDVFFIETVLMGVDIKDIDTTSTPTIETDSLRDLVNKDIVNINDKITYAWDFAQNVIQDALESRWTPFFKKTMENEEFALSFLNNVSSINPKLDSHPSFQKNIQGK
ncbi:MAG: nucleotidyl transferase AbiEii/AbiGii toxin family protein [Thermoplasmatota archaeon]